MDTFQLVTMVLHIIASLVLISVVLLQSGKAAGLSGSIAGGAESFFGKNKGRTIDAKLEKWTSLFAVVFLITCIVLGLLVGSISANNVDAITPDDTNNMTTEEYYDSMFGEGNWSVDPETGELMVDGGEMVVGDDEAAADDDSSVDDDASADDDAPVDNETPDGDETPIE